MLPSDHPQHLPQRLPWRAWRSRFGPRILFGFAVMLLIALGAWWLLLIGQSIRAQHQMTVQLLDREVYVAAMRLGLRPVPTAPGPLPEDARLEIVKHGGELRSPARWVGDGQLVVAEQPAGDRVWLIQPSATWTQQVADHYERRRQMVYGEGALLISLLGVVVAMLYQLIRSEKRFRSEMQEFLGRVTHEMKTPLAGIKAVLQTMQAGRMPQEQLQELVALALREADREEALVQNLLLAQRMRLPDQQLARDKVNLAPLFDKFAERRRETMGPSVQLEVSCPSHLAAVGDATALWTVLENLADNAIKYGAHRLQLHAERRGRDIHFALTDDGMGFEPHRSKEIFQAWSRSAGPHVGKRGTGLGLSICRALVLRMDGQMEAASPGPGKGATFSVLLPCWPDLT